MRKTKKYKLELEGQLICKEKLLIVVQESKYYWSLKDESKFANLSQHEKRIQNDIEVIKEKINDLTKQLK